MPAPDPAEQAEQAEQADLLRLTPGNAAILGAVAGLSQKRRRELFRVLLGGWCAGCGRRKRGGGPCPQCRPGSERP